MQARSLARHGSTSIRIVQSQTIISTAATTCFTMLSLLLPMTIITAVWLQLLLLLLLLIPLPPVQGMSSPSSSPPSTALNILGRSQFSHLCRHVVEICGVDGEPEAIAGAAVPTAKNHEPSTPPPKTPKDSRQQNSFTSKALYH